MKGITFFNGQEIRINIYLYVEDNEYVERIENVSDNWEYVESKSLIVPIDQLYEKVDQIVKDWYSVHWKVSYITTLEHSINIHLIEY